MSEDPARKKTAKDVTDFDLELWREEVDKDLLKWLADNDIDDIISKFMCLKEYRNAQDLINNHYFYMKCTGDVGRAGFNRIVSHRRIMKFYEDWDPLWDEKCMCAY